MVSTDITVWISAFFAISIWSILWKENPVYRIAEHTYVGFASAHTLVLYWRTFNNTAIKGISTGDLTWLIPIILGLMIIARLSRPQRWVSSWPMAIIIGIGMGTTARTIIRTQITNQISATISLAQFNTQNTLQLTTNFVLLLSVIASLVYFFFFIQHKGVIGGVARWGRLSLMAAFGTGLAYVFLQRSMSSVLRIIFLLRDWLGII